MTLFAAIKRCDTCAIGWLFDEHRLRQVRHSLILLTTYLAGSLLLAALIGWLLPKAAIWKYIDLLYYPLGAIGVLLLFASTNTQRRIIELAQAAEAVRGEVSILESSRSESTRLHQFAMVLASLDWLAEKNLRPSNFCSYPYDPSDQRCTVGRRVGPVAAAFLEDFSKLKGLAPERQRQRMCDQAEDLIQSLESKARLSTFVVDEALSFYREGQVRNMEFTEALHRPDTFVARVDDKIAKLKLDSRRPENQRRIDGYKAEAYYAHGVLQGLFICQTYKDGDEWLRKKDDLERQITEFEDRAKSIKDSVRDESPAAGFIRLYIWPYILISALALKFGKAVAGTRPPRQQPVAAPTPPTLQPSRTTTSHDRRWRPAPFPLRAKAFRKTST